MEAYTEVLGAVALTAMVLVLLLAAAFGVYTVVTDDD